MGLFKLLKAISDAEKEQVRKGYYQPDEFDRDDDEDSDEDY